MPPPHFMDAIVSGLLRLPWWVIVITLRAITLNLFFGNPKHYWKIRAAKNSLIKLKSIDSPQKQFGFLRTVDPFVFEEMILTALKDLGYKIKRNRRYTGDGGIDGRAVIDGEKTYIQAKRYKSHITASHVAEFSNICKRSRRKGLFVHTGKTGKQSWINGSVDHIDIVSGSRMLNLLTGKEFNHRWNTCSQHK